MEENSIKNSSEHTLSNRDSFLKYLGLAVLIITAASVIMKLFSKDTKCSTAITNGYWSDSVWISHQCVHQEYSKRDLNNCFSEKSKVIFVMDEMDAVEYTILWEEVVDPSTTNWEIVKRSEWSDTSLLTVYKELTESLSSENSALVVHKLPSNLFSSCQRADSMTALLAAQEQFLGAKSGVLLALLAPVWSSSRIEDQSCRERINSLYSNGSSRLHYIDTPPPPFERTPHEDTLPFELVLTLNLFCNSPVNASCCVPTEQFNSFTTFLSSTLLVCVLAVSLGVWLISITGATFALVPHLETLSFDVGQFFSLLNCVGGLAAILFYLLLADRLDFFVRADAPTSLMLFVVVMATIIFAAVATLKPNTNADTKGDVEALSHDQAKEWRGWMILMFIASHYTKTNRFLMVRLMNEWVVGVFLFLTGYTHFLSYWHTGELSWNRVAKRVLQQNALCLCVCVTLGSSYGSYYLVAVLTFWTLVAAFFYSLWMSKSMSLASFKYITHPRLKGFLKLTITLSVLALYLLVLSFTKEFWLSLFSWGPFPLVFESFSGSTDTLFYLFYQQRYIALSSVVFVYLIITVGTTLKSFLQRFQRQLKLAGVIVSVLILMGYLRFLYSCQNEQECSNMQAYAGILPILSYIFLRNGTFLCHYTSNFLCDVGSHFLWLFVSHFHILMALNGRGLLVFFPGHYYLNAVGVVTAYVFVFMLVRSYGNTVRDWLMAKKERNNEREDEDSNV